MVSTILIIFVTRKWVHMYAHGLSILVEKWFLKKENDHIIVKLLALLLRSESKKDFQLLNQTL